MQCAACGSPAAEGARFCDQCGKALGPTVDDRAGTTSGPDGPSREAAPGDHVTHRSGAGLAAEPGGDRRIVTALFADLVDYVRMLAEHDPEEVRAQVTAALGTMAAAVEQFGGTREKFIGDALFAVFGWPRGHDDDAVRAGLAALAIRAGLEAAGDGVEPMEVRIGIATGEVVAAVMQPGHDGDLGLTGEAITTAARIQSLARPGEILLDGATLRAARGRLATDAHGSVVLRGQSIPVQLFGLRGEAGLGAWSPHRPVLAGPLVGRAAEVERLTARLERLRSKGRGGIAVMVGDAGVGKTRLLAAMEARGAEPRAGLDLGRQRVVRPQRALSVRARVRPDDRRRARRRFRARWSAGCSSPRSCRPTRCVAMGAPSPRSRGTPPSPAGRRRRATCRTTRSRSRRRSWRWRPATSSA